MKVLVSVPEKASDHEEADTKLVALVNSADVNAGESFMVRSPSGDIDILVLFLLHQFEGKTVYIDNGTGKHRKIIDMSTSFLSAEQSQALAGMHAFSENDYMSSFFRKGKLMIWKLLLKNDKFMEAFADFGLFSTATGALKSTLEEFVCLMYGDKKFKKVNELRSTLFQQKLATVDLISLSPCSANLSLHIDRACYVANMFRESKRLMMLLDDPVERGWDANDEVKWTEDYFPEDVSRLLIFGSDAEINEREYSNDDDTVDDDNDSDDYDDDDYEED